TEQVHGGGPARGETCHRTHVLILRRRPTFSGGWGTGVTRPAGWLATTRLARYDGWPAKSTSRRGQRTGGPPGGRRVQPSDGSNRATGPTERRVQPSDGSNRATGPTERTGQHVCDEGRSHRLRNGPLFATFEYTVPRFGESPQVAVACSTSKS